ncbi:MAG TPA: diacylglycerol kinase [bacterium]|nr:diacylglycerol kinase [bacterium]
MFPGLHPVRSFPQALACAVRGLRLAAQTQRHFRAQLVIAAAALLFAAWAGLGPTELAVLAVTVAIVLGAELLNTAVEMLTDLLHPDRGPAAAAVKDVSAGAVLAAVVLAVAVGALVFLPRLTASAAAAVRAVPLLLTLLCLVVFIAGALRRR